MMGFVISQKECSLILGIRQLLLSSSMPDALHKPSCRIGNITPTLQMRRLGLRRAEQFAHDHPAGKWLSNLTECVMVAINISKVKLNKDECSIRVWLLLSSCISKRLYSTQSSECKSQRKELGCRSLHVELSAVMEMFDAVLFDRVAISHLWLLITSTWLSMNEELQFFKICFIEV